MYRIPDDFDASIFVGAELASVCFGPSVVTLAFEADDAVRVSVEGAYVHAGPASEGWSDEVCLPVGSSRLMQLTNHRVVEATRVDETHLALVFDHGHRLTLVDDTDQYESFQIETDKRHWII